MALDFGTLIRRRLRDALIAQISGQRPGLNRMGQNLWSRLLGVPRVRVGNVRAMVDPEPAPQPVGPVMSERMTAFNKAAMGKYLDEFGPMSAQRAPQGRALIGPAQRGASRSLVRPRYA